MYRLKYSGPSLQNQTQRRTPLWKEYIFLSTSTVMSGLIAPFSKGHLSNKNTRMYLAEWMSLLA